MILADSCLSKIHFQWHNSIEQIKRSDWETIFGNSIIKGYSFFLAMQKSQFAGVQFLYLEIFDHDQTVAIIPCFNYSLDIIDILADAKMKKVVIQVRKILPNFLKLQTFVVGSYAATCEQFIGMKKGLNEQDTETISDVINKQLKEKYQKSKASLLFIKDVREREIRNVKKILSDSFLFFSAFPTTVIPVGYNCSPYPVALKKKNRKRYRMFKDSFQADFKWEIITDFEEYTKLLERLYFNVLQLAKNKFEVLNESFFININKYFPKDSFLLIAKDKKDRIRLMEIVIEEEDRLLPLYVGIEYLKDDTKTLYLNTIFRTVEEAEYRGKDLIEFGQTSYYPKIMSGAFVENIHYGFYSSNVFMQFTIKHLFKKLFTPILIPSHVYLDTTKQEAINSLKRKNYNLMNE